LTELQTIEAIPIKKQEFVSAEKTRAFLNLPQSLQSQLLMCLLMCARLVRHIHFRIANETSRFLETGKAAEAKYRQLEDYRETLNRVALFLDLLGAGDANLKEIAKEVKRIQIEVA